MQRDRANEKEQFNQIKNNIEKEKDGLKKQIKENKEQITNMNIILENNKNKEIIDQINNIQKEIHKINTIIENINKYIQECKKEQNKILKNKE